MLKDPILHYTLHVFRVCASVCTCSCSLCQYLEPPSNTLACAAETRFYGSFIVVDRMIELKEAVQQTMVSSKFSSWADNQRAKVKEEAAAMKFICLNEEGFCKKESQLVEIFAPVVKLLRLTDSALPALSKVSCYDSHIDKSWHDNPTFDPGWSVAIVLQVYYYCSLFKENVYASSLTER